MKGRGFRFLPPVLVAVLVAVLGGSPARSANPGDAPLRLCADPDNLPFSSRDGPWKGIYVELAERMAEGMHRRVEVYWWASYIGGRTIRLTLLDGNCDAYFGLPRVKGFMGPRVIFTKPLFAVAYALVVPKTASVGSLDDLAGKRVGVQFNTPAQNALAAFDRIEAVTFREPEPAMEALAEGRVDAAFLWGPVAGYYNKTVLGDGFRVIPTKGPQLTFEAAIGVRGGETAFRDTLDAELDRHADTLARLMAKYGFPEGEPIVVDWLATRRVSEAGARKEGIVQAAALAAAPATQGIPAKPGGAKGEATDTAAGATNVAATGEAVVVEGKRLFNAILGCAHCHGPDAVAAESVTDLRKLRARYGERAGEVYREAVLNGRPEKGMPAWGELISEEEMSSVKVFLDTVQAAD